MREFVRDFCRICEETLHLEEPVVEIGSFQVEGQEGFSDLRPIFGAKQYIDFATRVIFWVGISFQLPMVMALLARLGAVRARQFLGFWRYAIIVVFLIAAIVTPTPDPLTQTLVAGPLLLLYCVGVFFAWMLQPPKAQTEPA